MYKVLKLQEPPWP